MNCALRPLTTDTHSIHMLFDVHAPLRPFKDTEEDDEGRPVTRAPTRASGAPLSIAEQYQLCNQVSKTLLVPITEAVGVRQKQRNTNKQICIG